MSIAIITGASSGLGRAYIDAIIRECRFGPSRDLLGW
ncbi:hypothetical protein Uis1B_1546 [Bifidobacterium margollesii]|uniref:Short-chain dehydrogenase n=1 Tax=Bifidobacterium margollesii TaxID=2020964 RepID=A0A2N5J8T4_9BIFI|nr:hypothetical protein Uis1B_1546 [Bifidobacterium margollesii]